MILVDAHEDLAWNSLTFGRDYMRSVEETRAAEAGTQVPARNGNTTIGWPEWIRGRVGVVFATLYAAPERYAREGWSVLRYAEPAEANRLYWKQVDFYRRWQEENEDRLRLITSRSDLEAVRAAWDGARTEEPQVGLVLSIEGADGIREPEELEAWYEAGVRIIGPAWSGTRYAGGTREPGPFTAEGRALMEVMASLGMILDLSHLTDEGAREALDRYEGRIIASHCNPRKLLPNSKYPERHLEDEVIRKLAEREGVLGIVLGNAFLKDGWSKEEGRQGVTLDHVVAHIDYVCQLLGNASHVGIGSDFDGGFGLESVPSDLDSVADLPKIGEALAARGYAAHEVEAVLGGNWLGLLSSALPES